MGCGHYAQPAIRYQDRKTIRRAYGQEDSGTAGYQGIAIAYEIPRTFRREDDIRMNLADSCDGDVSRPFGRQAGSKSMFQPGDLGKQGGLVDVAAIQEKGVSQILIV